MTRIKIDSSQIDEGIESLQYFIEIEDEEIVTSAGGKFYKCVGCSTPLFSSINILPDICKLPETLSVKNLMNPIFPCSDVCPFNEFIFIEPMKWMISDQLLTAEHSDELTCPNCKYAIGNYSWKGFRRCQDIKCFAGIGPSFRIDKSKLQD